MFKLRNVTGVPVSFNGVNDTVRFLKGQSKVFKDEEITLSIREGINNGSLLSEQIEEPKKETKEEPKKEEPVQKKNGKKNNKEVKE